MNHKILSKLSKSRTVYYYWTSFFPQIDKLALDHDNDLFYGLKVAGTSLGIVTEFLYKIHEEAGGRISKF